MLVISDQVFHVYAICTTILIVKMLVMSLLTTFYRFLKKVSFYTIFFNSVINLKRKNFCRILLVSRMSFFSINCLQKDCKLKQEWHIQILMWRGLDGIIYNNKYLLIDFIPHELIFAGLTKTTLKILSRFLSLACFFAVPIQIWLWRFGCLEFLLGFE